MWRQSAWSCAPPTRITRCGCSRMDVWNRWAWLTILSKRPSFHSLLHRDNDVICAFLFKFDLNLFSHYKFI